MTIPQALALALQHHQAGRLAEAEAIYRQILAVEPHHSGALHYLGVIAHQVGRHDLAIELIRQAIAANPHDSEAHSNLGNALYAKGELDEAVGAFRQAIALSPNFPEAYHNLGLALTDTGELDAAMVAYRQAIALQPNYPEAHSNLGEACRAAGQLDQAIAAYRQAIVLRPNFPEAYSNLGNALRAKGELHEAIAAGRHAITLKPGEPGAYNNLGHALKDQGQLEEAIAVYRQAIALRPSSPDAYSDLGNALREKGETNQAITAFRQAIALQPDLAEAHSNLGVALNDQSQFDEAIAAYRQALALQPDLAEAHYNLGRAHYDLGHLDEAIVSFRRAIALQPKLAMAHSSLLFCLRYLPDADSRSIAGEHRRWNQQHAEPLRQFIHPHRNDRTPERRLRIGYVSPDFREHSVAFFLESLLTAHDPTQVEVFCYANLGRPDPVTGRLRGLVPHWREIFGLPDAQVVELIREDQIDILIDLAGHTAGNRLLVFARKPAPVQVSWLGYPGSTGLEAIDYRLTDALADPPGSTDEPDSEKLVRLAEGAWCYRPCAEAPAISDPPVLRTGHLTFGCFNALPKITAPMLDLWSRLLHAVPGSQFLLKNGSMLEASTRNRLRREFENSGIAADRIELANRTPGQAEHLACYGRVDIALDTFPYHGTTTTCEALWMGVPVITLAGKTHCSRVGVSLLTHVGLPELIATSENHYLQLAAALAADLPRLTHLRRTLRERMRNSPLMDAPRFARSIEAAYREMWREWCASEG